MLQTHFTNPASSARSRWATASILAGILLTAACSEGGITVPPSAATPSPALAGSIVTDTSAGLAADVGIMTGALTNGGNHTGTISVALQTDTWTFSATQGQYLVVAMGEITGSSDFTPWIRLLDPNSTQIAEAWNAAATQVGIIAPLTGTYTVLAATADVGNNGTGDYRLMAAQLPGSFIVSPGDQGGAMTNGANHAGSILVGDVDVWSFSATQGTALYIGVGEVTGSADFTPWIRVIAPNGALLDQSWNAAAAQVAVAAPSTGTYTVLVSTADVGNDATGDYNLTMANGPGAITISPGDQGGPMTNGSRHSGTLTVGDLDAWTFVATQGDYLHLAVGEVTGSADYAPYIRLVSPNGTVLASAWNAGAAQIAVNAPLTGTYLVITTTADVGNDATGDYAITLAQNPGSLTISPGDQGGPMTNGSNHAGTIAVGDLDAFTFSATQGELIALAVGEVTGSADFAPYIRLVGPNGAILVTAWNAAAAQVQTNAPLTGTYMAVLSTADVGNDATGDYVVTLARAPGTFTISPGDQGGVGTNGGNNLGTINVGDLDVYTFTAGLGTPFAVSIGEVTGTDFNPWIRVVSPSGSVIGNAWNVAAAQFSAIAPLAGQYTVIVSTADVGNDGSGDYRLVVQKAGAFVTPPGDEGGAMANGAVNSGTIVVGDLDRWTFPANVGDYIAVSVGEVTGSDFNPWIRLVSPSGVVVGNSWNAAAAQVSVVATETGNYTVAIGTADVGNDGTGTYALNVAKGPGAFVVSPGDQGGAVSNGVHTGSITIGDLDMWSVTATAGSPIALTVSEVSWNADYAPWIRLVAPNGALIGNNWGGSSGTVNVAAPLTGTYTIILGTADSGNDATGSYNLSIGGVNLSPRPDMVPVVGQLNAFLSPRPTSYGLDGKR